jgi:DtxR family transcriptional regulator, Mn-dependent transcriptional regulator
VVLSPSLEDYLEEIYRFMLVNNNVVRVKDISKKLGVSLPSVSKALYKLNNQHYIKYHRYGEIELTDSGRQKGHYLVERNQLLQEFLALIRSDCNLAEEAEAIEHYLSESTIHSIHRLVSFFKANPAFYQAYLTFRQ